MSTHTHQRFVFRFFFNVSEIMYCIAHTSISYRLDAKVTTTAVQLYIYRVLYCCHAITCTKEFL